MSDPNPNPAPDEGSATPAEWVTAFAGDNADIAKALEPYKTPADFYNAFTAHSGELAKLKEAPSQDWRKTLAGDDEKALKLTERYSTPGDFLKAHVEAVNKIRSGELAKPLPKDAKPEQVAEWRKANGIPEKPEGYFEQLPNGRVIGAEDQPLFNEVAEKLHAHNVSPAAMHDLVEWYYGLSDDESAEIAEADKQHQQAFEDAMREAWGNDYRPNTNHVSNYLSSLPEGLQKAFGEGFGGDGRRLMHNPEFVSWLSNIAREFNPTGMVAVGGNESQMSSLEDEIAKLNRMSATDGKNYWGTKNETRHKELIAARLKLQQRMAG